MDPWDYREQLEAATLFLAERGDVLPVLSSVSV